MHPRTTIASAAASLSLLAGACGPQSSGAASDTPSSLRSTAVAASAVDSLTISRGGARPVQQGPAEQFTGAVRVEMLFAATDSSRAAGASVSFEPGARTAWHTHPLGQTLIVLSGLGLVQREGGEIEEIHPGDVVWFAPGEKHWHGASPTTAMSHIAIQESLDGKAVEWLEHVTDAQYRGARE